MKAALITVGIIVVIGFSIAMWAIGLSNTEKTTRIRAQAQEKVCTAYFDKMWKILQQKAGVTDQYKESFKDIYTGLIEGRYSNDGKAGQNTFMKWIQESNPTFSTELYSDLMASIEGERNGFFIEQEKLIDIDREHKTMRATFPNSLIIGDRPDIGIKVITSAKTGDVYKTSQENDIDLFKKETKEADKKK